MLASAVIVFREVLEAAIIISILAAATRDVSNRLRWLIAGLIAGLLGSALVAAGTDLIASYFDGIGQELFNAIVLGVAVLMLGWHNIWMSLHGKELASQARGIGSRIKNGNGECSLIFIVVSLAVLREGAETVLFLYGIASSDSNPFDNSVMLIGALIGAIVAVIVGYGIYAGLLRVALRWFFMVTSAMVLVLAAGMAASMARLLIQADLIPSLAYPLWDTSNILPEDGLLGMLLHSLIGYQATPAGMQVVFYVMTLVIISLGMMLVSKQSAIKKS